MCDDLALVFLQNLKIIKQLFKLITESEDYEEDFINVRLGVVAFDWNEKRQVEDRKTSEWRIETAREREERRLEHEESLN